MITTNVKDFFKIFKIGCFLSFNFTEKEREVFNVLLYKEGKSDNRRLMIKYFGIKNVPLFMKLLKLVITFINLQKDFIYRKLCQQC